MAEASNSRLRELLDMFERKNDETGAIKPETVEWGLKHPDQAFRRFASLLDLDRQAYERSLVRKV